MNTSDPKTGAEAELDFAIDEIKQGLDHIAGAIRRDDGKRTAYWIGIVSRQMMVFGRKYLPPPPEKRIIAPWKPSL